MFHRLIPSMFHRRLLLLMLVMVFAGTAVAVQLARLTITEGGKHLREAEQVLIARRLLPTVRGRILDVKGRVLAEDVPSEDIAVDYDVITGRWAYQKAVRAAYKAHRADWPDLSRGQRQVFIDKEQVAFDQQADQLWQLICEQGRLTREELDKRKAAVIERVQMIRADVW
ncbi:MAG: hypothetical protein WC058_16420, partial [Phycisphaeraceae bacterium]